MRRFTIINLLVIGILFVISSCQDSSVVQHNNPPPDDQGVVSGLTDKAKGVKESEADIIPREYIVVFKDQGETVRREQAAQQAKEKTQTLFNEYTIANDSLMSQYQYALKGFAAKLTTQQVKKLENDPRVDHISKNKMFYPATSISSLREKTNRSESILSSQMIPWGVTRVNGPLDGTGKTAWILDTGIDLDHPDLNVDVQNSISYIDGEDADDLVGHGTHVAGTIAAINNSQDVVGVAAGAEVVAVKVCSYFTDQYGRRFVGCPQNNILDGIDYVDSYASSDDIINMSLSGSSDSNIDNAVIDAADAGLQFTIAAGNEKQNANNVSPARVNHSNVWTVSAYREGDEFAETFDWNTPNCNPNQDKGSNYSNPPVDYAAPGENILSLWNNGGTFITCGTSMAAPHVAGLLLASNSDIDTDGTVSNDADSNPDPIAVAPILSVSISGPQFLDTGELGSWSANVSNADGSVSYEWYYKKEDWSGYVFGGSSSTFTHAFNVSEPDQAAVKVEVSSGGETAYDVQSVEVNRCVGGLQPDSKTIGINKKVPPCE